MNFEFLCAVLNFETFDLVTFWFPGSASETSGLVSSDKEYLKSAFVCPSCQNQNENDNEDTFYDQLSHWRVCSKYASMRISKDLDDDFQLTNYYSKIIKLRASEQEK